MKVYMEITQDEYQLPLKVAENAYELANMCGVSRSCIYNYISQTNLGRIKNPRYIKVEIDD